MKALLSVAGLLLIAVGLSLTSTDDANAGGCAAWRRCGPAVLVPAPNPIPLKRIRLNLAPCVVGCGPVAVAPAPVPCAAPCGASFYYMPTPVLRLLGAARLHRLLSRRVAVSRSRGPKPVGLSAQLVAEAAAERIVPAVPAEIAIAGPVAIWVGPWRLVPITALVHPAVALMNFLEVGARRGRVEGVETGAEDGGRSPSRGEPEREAAYYAN